MFHDGEASECERYQASLLGDTSDSAALALVIGGSDARNAGVLSVLHNPMHVYGTYQSSVRLEVMN